MASTLFITVLIILFPPMVLSQAPAAAPCASRLLTLAPCGPFVQGLIQLPAQSCCDGLSQIYVQEPTCLCLFLNNTSTLSPAFPINQTLAAQLPQLCSIPANSSACSGVSAPPDPSAAPPPRSSARSPISLGVKNNFTLAAPPVVHAAPRPTSITGFGLGRSSSAPNSKIQLTVLAAAAFLPGIFLV